MICFLLNTSIVSLITAVCKFQEHICTTVIKSLPRLYVLLACAVFHVLQVGTLLVPEVMAMFDCAPDTFVPWTARQIFTDPAIGAI